MKAAAAAQCIEIVIENIRQKQNGKTPRKTKLN